MLKRIDLNGWWKIKFDEDNQGTELGWLVMKFSRNTIVTTELPGILRKFMSPLKNCLIG
jgi:hypothetical protein